MYEMRKNVVQPERPQISVWRMRLACWICNTAFPQQQWFRERLSMFCYLMVTLHPFLANFLHWRTRRTHRPTALCLACGHTAHARRPRSRQFLMGLRVECIKMEEQLLLLENSLLKILLLEDERSDWVNPIFDEREKCG